MKKYLLMSLVAMAPAIAAAAELEEVPGFDGETITLGIISPLSGPVAVLGLPVTAGHEVWFERINEQGGIAGKYKVKLLTEDNANQEALTVQQYNKLKNQVVSFSQVFGTHTTKAILPQLRTDKMVVAPASFDSYWVHDPNLLPVGATYQIMAVNAFAHWLDTEADDDPVICGLVRDDPYGEAGMDGIKFVAEKRGLEIAAEVTLSQSDQDFTGQIEQLKSAGCEMVFVTTVPPQLARIVGNSARAGFEPRWIAQWPSWHGALLDSPVVDYLEKNVWLAGEGTEWGNQANSPGMAELEADIAAHKPDQAPNVWFVLGYNQARAVTAMIEKAVAHGDLSREGVMNALATMDNVDFGGLIGDYHYGAIEKRNPPRKSTVFGVDREKPFGLKSLKENFASPEAAEYSY
ncbi:ABC transporter substrate-binding protein [Microbaculum marinum]|uniref:ABC transporter substrate-binding protein n=1 Tax=Microbaculum marinum TaxID=1764581 RepID=A0AAW9RVD8_9HYPH